MTTLLEIIKSHRSIRSFTQQTIAPDVLHEIILAAQQASSSSFLQAASIIRITDPDLRSQVMKLSGDQSYIGSAPEFLIFCADFHRHTVMVPEAKTGFVEQLLIGATDAAMMAQNALLAAESMGMGGVYIGAVRNNPEELGQLLGLPELVVPMFGLCLGYPAQEPELKPRLPMDLIFFENQYREPTNELLEQYDDNMQRYYANRGSNIKNQTWSSQIHSILTKEARPFMLPYLQRKGFCLK